MGSALGALVRRRADLTAPLHPPFAKLSHTGPMTSSDPSAARRRGPWFPLLVIVGSAAWLVVLAALARRFL